jgi:competence protein ComEA
MGEGNGPVASEVVQRRLGELFAQLQAAPVAAEVTPRAEPAGDEEWLERLRPAAIEEPQPVAEERASALAGLPARMIEFTREHLVTVIVVLLVGVAWTAYSLLQVRTTPADAAPRVEVGSSASAAPPAATTSSVPPPSTQLRVHVIGAVLHPGVVVLPDGARVADAITAAGGLKPTAAIGELNLAQKVVDGTQLKIGTRAHPGGWIRDGTASSSEGSGGGSGGGAAKVSLNRATLQQLDALPGIGPVTAQKILDWRKAHGRFSAVTELQEVAGIGTKTYADLADLVQL